MYGFEEKIRLAVDNHLKVPELLLCAPVQWCTLEVLSSSSACMWFLPQTAPAAGALDSGAGG